VAGIFVPILHDENLLSPGVSVSCPANGRRPAPPVSLQELELKSAEGPQQFMECAHQLAGCYAYTLGYRNQAGRLCGIRLDPGQANNDDYLPIMADRPPFEQSNYSEVPEARNSPNHDWAGQNVLYLSGRAVFCKSRTVGVNRNDIYLNQDKLPEAGRDKWDSVLGASGFHPSLAQTAGD
jgi:hypothetical protein